MEMGWEDGGTGACIPPLLPWPQTLHTWSCNLSRVAFQPAPLYLPIPEKDHPVHGLSCLIQQGSFLFKHVYPLSCTHTYTHLGGSKMIDWRLRPQHLAEDGTTPLLVRESFLSP